MFNASETILFRTCRLCRSKLCCPLSRRYSSDLSHLIEDINSRPMRYFSDRIIATPTRLVKQTLPRITPFKDRFLLNASNLYPGHHLAYFPSKTETSSLLADGTDPYYSPGRPFNRCIWTGGTMEFLKPMPINSAPFTLTEQIVNARIEGQDDKQRVSMTIKRSIHPKHWALIRGSDAASDATRTCVAETRDLTFMRGKHPNRSTDEEHVSSKVLKPKVTPDVKQTLVPTPALLFRWSALTWNSHSIHLDKQHCQEVEGYQNLLVHGSLSALLILEVLDGHLTRWPGVLQKAGIEKISSFQYKNLAPLFAEEEMTICAKRKEDGPEGGSFDVWIEGRDGGYAVKGLVKTKKHDLEPPADIHQKESTSPATKASIEHDSTFIEGIRPVPYEPKASMPFRYNKEGKAKRQKPTRTPSGLAAQSSESEPPVKP